MERLTFEGNFCDIAQCRELPCPYNGECSQRKVWERLKAYEDTELTPEEVSALIKDWLRLCTTIRECGGIDRLRKLAEADKDGRVVVSCWIPVTERLPEDSVDTMRSVSRLGYDGQRSGSKSNRGMEQEG